MASHPHRKRAGRGPSMRSIALGFCLAVPFLGAGIAHANGLMGVRSAAHAVSAHQFVSAAIASSVHRDDTADSSKLVFALSGPVEPTAFVLSDPARVIVDLPQVDFAMDAAVGKAPAHSRHAKAGTLATSFRFGLLSPGRSRIVIDLAAPARIVRAAVVTKAGSTTLVVELTRTDEASFQLAAHRQSIAALAAPDAAAVSQAHGKATIVLDPGHGGPDTGAIVNGIVEKDVALAFANMLAAKLEATGNFNVVMTRSTDVFIPLSGRVQVARDSNAALMVSIHADTFPEAGDVSGATVYTVSDKASDAYAAKVAAKENEADAAGGIEPGAETADVNDILFDLTRQETRAYSHVFARTLVNYWKVVGRLNKNPQRSAGFVVLKAPDVPSVLLELGYLSSSTDSALLNSDEWREKATARMTEAIQAYFADQHGPAKAAAGVPIALSQPVPDTGAGAAAKH